MINQAARRNREHIEAGRVTFLPVALKDAHLTAHGFDKAFAINVRLFRSDAKREAEVLKRLLQPGGRLYLFQQHPSAERTQAVTEELRTALESNGFAIAEIKRTGRGAASMTCIVAATPVDRHR
jgi:hypothetical protein